MLTDLSSGCVKGPEFTERRLIRSLLCAATLQYIPQKKFNIYTLLYIIIIEYDDSILLWLVAKTSHC